METKTDLEMIEMVFFRPGHKGMVGIPLLHKKDMVIEYTG